MNRCRLVALVAAALPLSARAQLRPAARPRCVVTAHAAVALDDALDPRTPPAVLLLDTVTVLAWRDRADALRVQRFAPDLRALEDPRIIAQPVHIFTMARTPTGFALAYVERDHDLVVARRAESLEAQNVPRVIESLTAPTAALAFAAFAGGSLVAWATPTDVRVMSLDARGVPQGAASVVLEQPRSRALSLDPGDPITLRVDVSDPAVEPWVFTLQPDGAVASRSRWPLGALGPVRLGDSALTAQINPLGSPMLLRGNAVVAPAAIADPAVTPRAQLDALAVDRDLAIALVSDSSVGRQSLTRLMPDGSASWLAGVRGVIQGPATFAVQAPGVVALLTRDGAHSPSRTVLQRYACVWP